MAIATAFIHHIIAYSSHGQSDYELDDDDDDDDIRDSFLEVGRRNTKPN